MKAQIFVNRETLKAIQAPIKSRYQNEPESALDKLHAMGIVDFDPPGCRVALPCNNGMEITTGLHPKAGGDGQLACSGDMLLQALVSCAGTTLAAVSISMGLRITHATIEAVGTMDFRGTLGVSRNVPVGLTKIEMRFHLETPADKSQIEKLVQLTERYCVVYQTLAQSVAIESQLR